MHVRSVLSADARQSVGCGHGAGLVGADGLCVLCGAGAPRPPSALAALLASIPPDGDAPRFEQLVPRGEYVPDPTIGPQVAGDEEAEPDPRDDLEGYLAKMNAELARRELYEFVKLGWNELEPGVKFEDNWHIRDFCAHVQWMLEGWLCANGHGSPEMEANQATFWKRLGLKRRTAQLLVQNLIANIPPGTLKSRILMVFAPAWMWLHCPQWSMCAISSVEENVIRDSNAHKDLVKSLWYRETFNVKWSIRRDTDSVAKWQNTAGGERLSRRLLGKFTGIHVDAIFCDDPDDADQVHSLPARTKVHKKWSRAIKNRVNHLDKCIRIIIQQRVHVEDLSGYLLGKSQWSKLKRQGWAWLCLPLQFGHGPKDQPRETPWGWKDPRFTHGELLHPKRFSLEAIAEEKIEKGSSGFAAQYNQNPSHSDGGLIDRKLFRFFRVADGIDKLGNYQTPGGRPEGCYAGPAFTLERKGDRLDLDWLSLTVDATFGSLSATASGVGLLVVGGKANRRFVFDDGSKPMTLSQTKEAIRKLIAKWPIKRCFVENKANGRSIIDDLRDELALGQLVEGHAKRVPLLGPDGLPAHVVLEECEPGKDSKEARAQAMKGAYEAGFVFLLDGAVWLDEHITEVCTFPHASRDDRVDAMSQLMTYYRRAAGAAARTRGLNC